MSPSTEIRDIAISLGVLAGQVNEEQWAFINLVRENLYAQADAMLNIENNALINPVNVEKEQ